MLDAKIRCLYEDDRQEKSVSLFKKFTFNLEIKGSTLHSSCRLECTPHWRTKVNAGHRSQEQDTQSAGTEARLTSEEMSKTSSES